MSAPRTAEQREAAAEERARRRAGAAGGERRSPDSTTDGVAATRPIRTRSSRRSTPPDLPSGPQGTTIRARSSRRSTANRPPLNLSGLRSLPVVQQRRAVAAALGLSAVVAIGVWAAGLGSEDRNSAGAAHRDRPAPLPQLPGGGRRILPDRRVVAFYGNPQDTGLGALGVGSARSMVARLRKQAQPYGRRTRPVLPALELISSVAAASPGARGDYSIRASAQVISRYLRVARRAKALLLLDVQPGLADFPSEIRRLRPWLRQPDVGLALDPEWRLQPGQIPGQVIGSVAADEVNTVSAELAQIVRVNRLPQKLFVIHQFTEGMISSPERVIRRPGLATVFNVDGFGNEAVKIDKYKSLVAGKPGFHHGFKLFYEEDKGLMTPSSVMGLNPRPDLIVYE